MATKPASSSIGGLQLLAEHPTWTWTQASSLGTRSEWTAYLQKLGFSASDISNFLSGKLTAAQLIAKKPATGQGNGSGAGTAASQGAQAVANATGLSSIGDIVGFITSGKNWVRLGEVIVGIVLIAMGLHQLTGAGGTVVNVAKTGAKVATVAAVA